MTEKSATPVLAAIKGRRTMKCICLGYYDRCKPEAMTEAEKQAGAPRSAVWYVGLGMLRSQF